MKKIVVKIKRVGGSLMLPIPRPIADMFDWKEEDSLLIPFHEIEKAPEDQIESIPAANIIEKDGKKEVKIKIRGHGEKLITQEKAIQIMESVDENPDLLKYRTTYTIWNGNRIGVRNLCKKLFEHDDFHTTQGTKVLKNLGLKIYNTKK